MDGEDKEDTDKVDKAAGEDRDKEDKVDGEDKAKEATEGREVSEAASV